MLVAVDLELQPGAPGHLHLRAQAQQVVGLEGLDAPEVERRADRRRLRVAAAAAQADAADEQVERSRAGARARCRSTSRAAADAADRRERLRRRRPAPRARGESISRAPAWRRRAPSRPLAGAERVGPARLGELAVLVARAPARSPRGSRAAGSGSARARVGSRTTVSCGRLSISFAADARVDRRHESEPEAREARRQHRHADQQPPQAALARVLAHQVAVGRDVGAADLEDLAAAGVRSSAASEVGEQVLDRDRLGARAAPSAA